MRKSVAERILSENQRSYDRMAEEFSSTRKSFWKDLEFLGEHATPGMKVLDIGCGNGRLLDVLSSRQIEYVGVDSSRGLIGEAKKRYPDNEFIEGDATELPFPNNTFNIAYAFAIIHHIPGKALRKKFVREAARVLRPGSTFILTSWYLWQPKYFAKLFGTIMKSMLFISPLDIGDMMHTFGKKRADRYLHAFTVRELTRLLNKNGFEVVGSEIVERESGSGSKNIVIVARKRDK